MNDYAVCFVLFTHNEDAHDDDHDDGINETGRGTVPGVSDPRLIVNVAVVGGQVVFDVAREVSGVVEGGGVEQGGRIEPGGIEGKPPPGRILVIHEEGVVEG